MKNTLMLDIETTGTKPGCKVLTLGVCGYTKDGKYVTFYERINPIDSENACLVDERGTMDWWQHQDENVRHEAFCGQKTPVEVCAEFKQFIYEHFDTKNKFDKFTAWCCGLDFDFPILRHVFEILGVSFPIPFWTQCDYRTLKNIFPEIKNAEQNGAKHTALEDAEAQMRGLENFMRFYKKA